MTYSRRKNAWRKILKALFISHVLAFVFLVARPVNASIMIEPDIIETSDIVFIPGLQASRLYTQQIFENQLWEPNRNADVEKLFLTDAGQSILPNIYTRDVIDEAYGYNTYKKFISFLNGLKQDFIIVNWSVIPYDWRYSPQQIVADGIPLAGGSRLNVLDTIRSNAAVSPSGKVTLITHSNGALLAKEIIERLGEEEATHLIDQLIMVAPPQLGTPKAIASMLHGDEQDFAKGLLVNKPTARELGEDMKSAYALLPSEEYFNRVDTEAQPLITFDPSVDAVGFSSLRQKYHGEVNSYDELKSFLTGENGIRPEPATTDIFTPNVLKGSFLDEAQAAHTEWDAWQPPEGLKVTQIVGWGLDTIRGLRYFANTSYACPSSGTPCTPYSTIDHEPLFTKDGDDTVVAPSAASNNNEESFYVDIDAHNHELFGGRRNREHGDILEIEPLQELLSLLFQKKELTELPPDISSTKPEGTNSLVLRVHSPVKVDVYDSQGNHIGLIPNPNPTSDLRLYEEQIPNSSYNEVGEGKYITLDTNDTYQLKFQGTAIGTFSLKVEETNSDTVVKTKEFTDIPITPATKASLTTQTVDTTSQLSLDIEGDGKVDLTLGQNQKLDPITNIKILQKIIQASSMTKQLKNAITAELEVVKKLVENKNKIAARVLLAVIEAELKNAKNVGLTKQEVVQLVYMVDQIKISL